MHIQKDFFFKFLLLEIVAWDFEKIAQYISERIRNFL